MDRPTFLRAVVDLCRKAPRVEFPPLAVCEVIKAHEGAITYQRGRSRFKVKLQDLYDVVERFSGQRVTASEIRAFRPEVFDSSARPAGHSCNVSLLFSLLLLLGIAHELQGRGVRGDPYSVSVHKNDT